MQTGLEVEWFDGGLGWVYFYRGQAHENLLEMKEALDDYNESLEAWNYVPDVTAGTIHDHTQVQRQVRTVHFQRGDLLCGTAAQSRSLSHQLPHRCCSVSRRFAALVSAWWLANAVSCSCRAYPHTAGFCGGEQIGAMRSQLGATADFDAAIADYSYVIDSPLTYPGTTNHAVTCARRGERTVEALAS